MHVCRKAFIHLAAVPKDFRLCGSSLRKLSDAWLRESLADEAE